MKRLFIAIDLPASIKRYLVDQYDETLPDVRWTPEANLHLTMRFLGDVSEEQEKEVRAELSQIRISRFTLEIGSLGMFPQKGDPKVLWFGLGSGHPHLFQLRQKIDDAILQVGIDCDMRDFVPHLTIGRCSGLSRARLAPCEKRLKDHQGPAFFVNEFTLFESRRTASGVSYHSIDRFPCA